MKCHTKANYELVKLYQYSYFLGVTFPILWNKRIMAKWGPNTVSRMVSDKCIVQEHVFLVNAFGLMTKIFISFNKWIYKLSIWPSWPYDDPLSLCTLTKGYLVQKHLYLLVFGKLNETKNYYEQLICLYIMKIQYMTVLFSCFIKNVQWMQLYCLRIIVSNMIYYTSI